VKNPALGRKILDHITANRDQFDMSDYGFSSECGTTACIAGWAMLLSGYQVDANGSWSSPDDTPVHGGYLSAEARALLGLDDAEYYGDSFEPSTLFGEADEDRAIKRFRAIVEASEAEVARGQ